ncbi:MAG: hypothetical protein ACR2HR_08660 [Euzebya sp.]
MTEAKQGEPATWCGPLPSDPDVLVGNLPGLKVALEQGVDAVVSLCRVGMAEVPDGVEHHRVRLIDKPGKQHNPNLEFVLRDTVEAVTALRAEGRRVFGDALGR